MRDYTQLTQEERYQIAALLKMGHCQSEIADALNRDKSTISREVRRNRGLRERVDREERLQPLQEPGFSWRGRPGSTGRRGRGPEPPSGAAEGRGRRFREWPRDSVRQRGSRVR